MNIPHSPGPWRIENGRVLDANGASVGELVYWASCDLALALAAPELLAVLEEYLATVPAFRSKPVGAVGSAARAHQQFLIALEDRAKAAVALAKGGAS